MKIHSTSHFKDEIADHAHFEKWVAHLEKLNGRQYDRFQVSTSLGKTHVWGLNTKYSAQETLVIFPGARTTALFWDFDKGLDKLHHPVRIFMVETNGLPNLSDGSTPDIKSLDYGFWATEVLDKLKIESAFVAGGFLRWIGLYEACHRESAQSQGGIPPQSRMPATLLDVDEESLLQPASDI